MKIKISKENRPVAISIVVIILLIGLWGYGHYKAKARESVINWIRENKGMCIPDLYPQWVGKLPSPFSGIVKELYPKKYKIIALKNVNSLEMLSAFDDVERLGLFNASVKSLDDIKHLSGGLKDLSLNGTRLKDISELKHFSHLESLTLGGFHVSDWKIFDHLPKLQNLYIGNPEVAKRKLKGRGIKISYGGKRRHHHDHNER